MIVYDPSESYLENIIPPDLAVLKQPKVEISAPSVWNVSFSLEEIIKFLYFFSVKKF